MHTLLLRIPWNFRLLTPHTRTRVTRSKRNTQGNMLRTRRRLLSKAVRPSLQMYSRLCRCFVENNRKVLMISTETPRVPSQWKGGKLVWIGWHCFRSRHFAICCASGSLTIIVANLGFIWASYWFNEIGDLKKTNFEFRRWIITAHDDWSSGACK